MHGETTKVTLFIGLNIYVGFYFVFPAPYTLFRGLL